MSTLRRRCLSLDDSPSTADKPGFAPVPRVPRHVFSVCLYHEPEFSIRFPARDFSARYLERMPEVRELFARHGFALRIFCDQVMLETAQGIGFGEVFLVTDPPAFPFAQHLWRYYSVLLPGAETHCHHFRGCDNLAVTPEEIGLLNEFAATGGEILHAPYLRARGQVYTPVRGSCSVAGLGARTLARHLCDRRPASSGPWPSDWHCDEIWLAEWFADVRLRCRLHTLIDREQPPEFYDQLRSQIAHAPGFRLTRLPQRGVMSSTP